MGMLRAWARRALTLALLLALWAIPAAAEYEKATVHRYGDSESPRIAITMDDCNRMQHVTAMLDLCDEYGIRVTFFPIGRNLKEEDAAIWQRVVEGGHEIGNHTYEHKKLLHLKREAAYQQLVQTEQQLDLVLGYPYYIRCFRPPYGTTGYPPHLLEYSEFGYPDVILWSVSQTDPKIAIKQVKNGSILLFHAMQADVDCLRELIPKLLEKGFEPVTVSELLGLEPVERER